MKKKKQPSLHGWLKKTEISGINILGILGDAIAIFAYPHGELIYCNRRFQELSEYSLQELKEKDYSDFILEKYLPMVRERFAQRIQGLNPPSNYEIGVRSKSGRLYTMDILVQLYPGIQNPKGILISMRDITEKRERQSRLEESEEKHRTLVERSLEGVMIIKGTRVQYANPRMLELMGAAESEFLERDITDFIHPDDRASVKKHIQERLEGSPLRQPQELRLSKKNGNTIYVEALSILIEYQSEPALLITYRDITDRKHQEERIQELIITDTLTGLFNRQHLYNQLNAEIDRAQRQGSPLSLIMIDIDNFKQYNDAYGHIEGDRVLESLAEVIRKSKRRYDSGFRYGGEEFVVICPGIIGRQAIIVAERLRREFEKERFNPGKNGFKKVTISLGVASLKKGDTVESFINYADEAMYTSKRNGKNRSTLASNHEFDKEVSSPRNNGGSKP